MNDDRIINYMKARNKQAQMTATAVAVQLFALAVYLCMYALSVSGLFWSKSARTGKIVIVLLTIAISVFLCVINFMTVIHTDQVYITRPDNISLRDGEDVVRLAYTTARPVLIFKITCSLVMMAAAGVVYIILLTIMEDTALANIYGRIVCCIIPAVAIMIAYPCIDRIACYRALLNETHELYLNTRPGKVPMYIASVALPLSVCLWYILRYYGDLSRIAWITYPVVALFALAVSFLYSWSRG